MLPPNPPRALLFLLVALPLVGLLSCASTPTCKCGESAIPEGANAEFKAEDSESGSTEDDANTRPTELARVSRRTAAQLEQSVLARAYVTQDAPVPMEKLHSRVRTLLEAYKRHADGDLSVEILDPYAKEKKPADRKKLQREAKEHGCSPTSRSTKASARPIYGCVVFTTPDGDRVDAVDSLAEMPRPRTSLLEYEITKTLMAHAGKTVGSVAFITGRGGPLSEKEFRNKLEPGFERFYGGLLRPTFVDASSGDFAIPDDARAVVLLNPRDSVPEDIQTAIDAFLQRGGSVGWFQSSTAPDSSEEGQSAARNRVPLEPDLREMFATYGLDLRSDLVLDRNHGQLGFGRTGDGKGARRFPMTFVTDRLKSSALPTRHLSKIVLPAPSSIAIADAVSNDDTIESTELVRTPPTARRRPGIVTDFSKEHLDEKTDAEEEGPFVLAASLLGDLPAAFETNEDLADGSTQPTDAPSRLLVVGSGSFLRPERNIGFKRRLAARGQQVFFSSVEWLALPADLVALADGS